MLTMPTPLKKVCWFILLSGIIIHCSTLIAIFRQDAHPEWNPELGKRLAFGIREKSCIDFFAHFAFSKALLEKKVDRPFTLEGQNKASELQLGLKESLMLSAYFPSFYAWIGIFHCLSPEFAYVLFMILTYAAFLFYLVKIIDRKDTDLYTLLLLGGCLLCNLTVQIVSFGQCTFLYAAILGFILLRLHPTAPPFSTEIKILIVLSFPLIMMKPPIGGLLLFFLLLCKEYRVLAWSVLFTLLLALIAIFPLNWLDTFRDYFAFLQRFYEINVRNEAAHPVYFQFHDNLITAYHQLFHPPFHLAERTNALIGTFLFSLSTLLFISKRIRSDHLAQLLATSYTLFSPYFTAADNYILTPVLWNQFFLENNSSQRKLFLSVIAIVLFNSSPPQPLFTSSFIPLTFLAKASLFLSILFDSTLIQGKNPKLTG